MAELNVKIADLPEVQEIVRENIALHDRVWLLQTKLSAVALVVANMEDSCEPDVCAYASEIAKTLERV